MWIDSHCHLDASEFDADRDAVRSAARQAGVQWCVIPSVQRSNFEAVRALAHRYGDMYALGIHPLYVPTSSESDLNFLDEQLATFKTDQHLVAVGEIGLDYFVPNLCTPAMRERQWHFYLAQLKIAKRHQIPVILHVRKSADMLLKGLRQVHWPLGLGGIAHAFNGSLEQAKTFISFGFKLGFGGTVTYERSSQIRRLAQELPIGSIVLETDAPDMQPQWLYKTAHERLLGNAMQKNSPIELASIGELLASLRGCSTPDLAFASTRNVQQLFSRFAFD